MSKKYIFMALVLLVLAGVIYYYWKTQLQSKPVTSVVAPVATPVESEQSANPYDKTNPFSDIKVNPFE